MRAFFESSSWLLFSLLIVIPCTLVCLWLLWILRKRFATRELKKSHDVVGFTFSIVGVLYSVILGFTVIAAQNHYNVMRQSIHTEAILLADLYEDAAYFSPHECALIRQSLRQYIDHVIKEEWWNAEERVINMQSQMYIKEIKDSYYNVEITSEKGKIWYAESIGKFNNFMNASLERQFNSWVHLGAMMWTLLIVGAVIVICFMFFFGLENIRSHMLLTALLAGYLFFILYLIYTLDNAFQGPLGLKPTALEQVSHLFNEWDKDTGS